MSTDCKPSPSIVRKLTLAAGVLSPYLLSLSGVFVAYIVQFNGGSTSSATPPNPVPSAIPRPQNMYPVPSFNMLNDANYLALAPSAAMAPNPPENPSNLSNYTDYLPPAVFGQSSVLNGLVGIAGNNGGGGGAGGGDDGGDGYGGGRGRGSLSPFQSFFWWKGDQEKVIDEIEVAQARADAQIANREIFVEYVEPSDQNIAYNLQMMEHAKLMNEMYMQKLPSSEIGNQFDDINLTKAEGKNTLISA